MSDERTERATPRRRQQAAEKGDRVRSRELTSSASMMAGVIALGMLAAKWAEQWSSAYQRCLALGSPRFWEPEQLTGTVLAIRSELLTYLSPLLLVFAAVTASALLFTLGQSGGVRINPEAIGIKWERFNPVTNIKNLFSLRVVERMAKLMLPASLLAFLTIREFSSQMAMPPLSIERMPEIFHVTYNILLDTAWVLFGWSAVDYLVEWRSWENRQKMSKQDIRDEHKQMEGSPQIRGRIRSLRRQMHRKRMKADVSRATVVITNPTHYAVALSFDFETMDPPKVVAKGRDFLAEQIKEEARWAGIPIVENPPLARSLYKHVEPGQAIPFHLYSAIAAILAWLYRQQIEEKLRREKERQKAAAAAANAAKVQAAARAAKVRPVFEESQSR
jgi:flagellar biosynthesis protein FlhB